MTENEISKILINIFFKVHSKLGPGLLESVYEAAICHELDHINLRYKRQQGIRVVYDDVKLDIGFRAELSLKIRSSSKLNQWKQFHRYFLKPY